MSHRLLPRARACGILSAAILGAAAAAQGCVDFGSTPTPATWSAAPVALACPAAPGWPQWRLFTPAHRAPSPHVGFRPGAVRERRALLVRYACTGLVFVPVLPIRVRVMGYVVDMAEHACS